MSVPAESKGTLSSLLVAPDKALSALLAAETPAGRAAEGIKILISGPGGIGKSALYRKILADEIHRYKTGTTRRIPVLCAPGKKPWREVLHDALGLQALPLELLDVQLEANDFTIFADGLTEADVSIDELTKFVMSEAGAHTAMVMSARNNVELIRCIERSGYWTRVTPLPLALPEPESAAADGSAATTRVDTLTPFVQAYSKLDRCPQSFDNLINTIKSVCKGISGMYSPVLVRLAVRASADGGQPGSVSSIYERALQLLTQRVGAGNATLYSVLRPMVIECAFKAYWGNVSRTCVFEKDEASLKVLKGAGVLVDAPAALGVRIDTSVRFFHDSMQSYFAAVGLSSTKTPDLQERVLLWVAGSPEYRVHRSELFGYSGAELFCMVSHILPSPTAVKLMLSTLKSAADGLDDKLTRDLVYQAIPQTFHDLAPAQIAGSSGGAFLNTVLVAIQTSPKADELEVLCAIYAQLAPVIFDLTHPERPVVSLS